MLSKKLMLVAAALLLAIPVLGSAALHGAPATAQEPPEGERSITVTGYGVAYGSPDIARLGLGVETSNADVQIALDENNSRLEAVLAALREAGIADADQIAFGLDGASRNAADWRGHRGPREVQAGLLQIGLRDGIRRNRIVMFSLADGLMREQPLQPDGFPRRLLCLCLCIRQRVFIRRAIDLEQRLTGFNRRAFLI